MTLKEVVLYWYNMDSWEIEARIVGFDPDKIASIFCLFHLIEINRIYIRIDLGHGFSFLGSLIFSLFF